jgi:hypothetical protein
MLQLLSAHAALVLALAVIIGGFGAAYLVERLLGFPALTQRDREVAFLALHVAFTGRVPRGDHWA